MTEMPSPDSLPPEGLNEGVPEGEPAPMDPTMGAPEDLGGMPPGPPEGDPMEGAPADPSLAERLQDPTAVIDDVDEIEARDELQLQLLLAAIKLTNAVGISIGGDAAQNAERYASAAQHLTQAAVLLEPQEAIDDVTAAGGSPEQIDATRSLMETTTKGLRRTSGS